MKKILLFTSILCLSFTSCNNEDDSKSSSEKEALLVGKWNMIKAEFYKEGKLQDSKSLKSGECEYNYYNFKEDKTKDEIYHNANADCATENDLGKWSYNGKLNQITLIDNEDGYTFIAEVISINENSAKFKVVSDGGEKPKEEEIYYILEK